MGPFLYLAPWFPNAATSYQNGNQDDTGSKLSIWFEGVIKYTAYVSIPQIQQDKTTDCV